MEQVIKEEPVYTAVCYTDGSTGPSNPSWTGSGMHGYLYKDEDIKEKLNDAPNGYLMCTKGYVKIDLAKNLTKVLPSYYINGLYTYDHIATNNFGEGKAITTTIKKLLESDIGLKKIYIKTDSSYAKGIFDRLIMDEYKIEELSLRPNSDIWFEALDLLKELAKNNIEIEIIKVLGHSDVLGNIITDSLANLARYNSERNVIGEFFKITPNQKYWKPNIKKEPMLNVKSLFFNHSDRELNPYRYVIMDYNTTNEIGTNDNSALFGLVYTKGQFEDIEYVLEMDKRLCKHHYTLSELNMHTFYSQEYNYYKEHFGDMVFKPNRRESGFDIFDLPLTYSTFQGLAKVAFNRTLELEKTYKDYITFKAGDTLEHSEFIDITHLIYKDNDKGKRVCFLDQNEKFLNYIYPYNGKDVKITLSVGTEIPTRNILKNIEKEVRNVYLEIVKKDKILQTNVVIVTDDIIGVYTNFFTRNVITK